MPVDARSAGERDRRLGSRARRPRGLDSIFRFVHTVKGNCGFFDFPRLEALSHATPKVGVFRAIARSTVERDYVMKMLCATSPAYGAGAIDDPGLCSDP